ncbi:MAG: T9SS type A sorting domain-containing protein [Reichenbachiella sp.]|uniref:T9SS type A sorting domain-containing protein n=1 Tax=Reichenbachiella sp. TaxID=2184521 RepID=UPI0032981022
MKNILLSFLFSLSLHCSAQELAPSIFASAGGFYTGADIQLSWTLSGAILDSYTNSEVSLSSGVQVEEVDPYVLDVNRDIVNIQAFPNPIQDQLTLQFDDMVSNYQIIISDLTGRTVYQDFTTHTNQKIIDVSHLGIGAYAMQILDSSQQPIKKFKLSKTR